MTPQEAFVLISSRTACVDFDLDFDGPSISRCYRRRRRRHPPPAVIVAAPAGSLIWVETRFELALQPTSGPTPSRDAVVVVCWMSGEMSNLVTWR